MKRLKSSFGQLLAITLAILFLGCVTTNAANQNTTVEKNQVKVEAITGSSGGTADVLSNTESGLKEDGTTAEEMIGKMAAVRLKTNQAAETMSSNTAKKNVKVATHLNEKDITVDNSAGGLDNANLMKTVIIGRFTAAPTQIMNVDMAAYFNITATNMTALYGFTDANNNIKVDNSLVYRGATNTFDTQNITTAYCFTGAAPLLVGFTAPNISDNNVNMTVSNNYFC